MSNSSRIGDTSPLSTKKISVLKQIQRGLVIKAYVPRVGHDKYFVFMGFSKDSIFAYSFFISSEPSLIIITNPGMAHLQVEIPPGSYKFLPKPKPSYINCLKFYEQNAINLINGLIESPSKLQGYLTPKHRWEVVQATQNNQTFSPNDKNIFVAPLILPPSLCPITTLF